MPGVEFEHKPNYEFEENLFSRLESHSAWTAQHSLRVGMIARGISEAAELPEEICDLMERAGKMHDIGKLQISKGILDYPGKLSEVKQTIMRTHAQRSFNLVRGYDYQLARIVVAHHNKFDVNDFPERGKHLRYLQMVLSLADRVDALRSKRPYNPAFGEKRILKSLEPYFPPELLETAINLRLQMES